MKLPSCCHQEMAVKFESHRFVEAVCQKCSDTVYVKKRGELKPELVDD